MTEDVRRGGACGRGLRRRAPGDGSWIILLLGCMLALVPTRSVAFIAQPVLLGRSGAWGRGNCERMIRSCCSQRRATAVAATSMMSDFQENVEGIAIGDRVKVTGTGLKFYHIAKFKEEGFDPNGMVGEVKDIKLFDKKRNVELTANMPVMVAFTDPKFIAHFQFTELTKEAGPSS